MPYVLRKPWQAIHERRLGENEFLLRLVHLVFYRRYLPRAKMAGRQRLRLKKSGVALLWGLIGIEVWGVQVHLSALCYGDLATEFVRAVFAKQSAAVDREQVAEERRRARKREDEERRARVSEILKRLAEEETPQEREDRERQRLLRQWWEGNIKDPFAWAVWILGLSEQFSRAEFVKGYRRAMRKAHPDAGGRTWEAQAVNAAREVIRQRNGW